MSPRLFVESALSPLQASDVEVERPLWISIAAGIALARIEAWLAGEVRSDITAATPTPWD